MSKHNLILCGNGFLDKNIEKPFLIGEWILKDIPEHKNKINIPYFHSNSYLKENKIESLKITEKIYESIKIDLSDQLNKLHSINFSKRSWQIIYGYWLLHFIGICVERFQRLDQVLQNKNIDKIYLKNDKEFRFYTKDTFGLNLNSINEDWENNLYYRIIKYFKIKNELVSSPSESNGENLTVSEYYNTDRKNLKNFFYKLIFKFLNFFNINDIVITNTYLPRIYELILQIIFKQVPMKYDLQKIEYKSYNSELRNKINLVNSKNINLENFIRSIIPECLPVCFIESFENILNLSEDKQLPKNPKLIFTSISYAYDEFFKFYVAKNIKKKTKYFIGQHGNDYFSNFNLEEKIDLESANKFISWGYKVNKNIIQGFNFKVFKRKQNYNKKGNLLIISTPSLHRIFPYDTQYEFKNSLTNISILKDRLKEEISKEITLKVDRDFKSKLGNYYKKSVLKNFKTNQIIHDEIHFNKLITKSRLCIFNYNSTGLLENLSLNVPTNIIWSGVENNLNSEFKKKFSILREIKILFDKTDELAEHINNNWEDLNIWWSSKNVQSGIKEFNKNYNETGNLKSLIKLRNKINDELKHD